VVTDWQGNLLQQNALPAPLSTDASAWNGVLGAPTLANIDADADWNWSSAPSARVHACCGALGAAASCARAHNRLSTLIVKGLGGVAAGAAA
jgi:hypothetical protein